jgi:hypothetical protein
MQTERKDRISYSIPDGTYKRDLLKVRKRYGYKRRYPGNPHSNLDIQPQHYGYCYSKKTIPETVTTYVPAKNPQNTARAGQRE